MCSRKCRIEPPPGLNTGGDVDGMMSINSRTSGFDDEMSERVLYGVEGGRSINT